MFGFAGCQTVALRFGVTVPSISFELPYTDCRLVRQPAFFHPQGVPGGKTAACKGSGR